MENKKKQKLLGILKDFRIYDYCKKNGFPIILREIKQPKGAASIIWQKK